MQSEFIFAITNSGSEKALKLEVEAAQLGWRLSYQRRGLVTFKAAMSEDGFSFAALTTPLSCARRLCLSLGKAQSFADAEMRIQQHASYAGSGIHHVCFSDRRMQRVGDLTAVRPKTGDCIGTVVELSADEFWVGLHQHRPFLSVDPGGDSSLEMVADSPSRAWLKLEEAVRFFDLKFSERDLVVEVGCAPGGVVLALLRRGVSVIGVDPAKMAAVVMESAIAERSKMLVNQPWFYHCRKPAALVSKRDLGAGVTWFMSDMNQSPTVVLKECERFCKMTGTIRNVLITLKLTTMEQILEKQTWFETLKNLGFKSIHLQQLSVHHREFALLAIR